MPNAHDPRNPRNPHKGRVGLTRVAHAGLNSMAGLWAALRHESAFRQECALALPMLPAAWWLGTDWISRALLIGSVVLVLIVELLNSGIETAIDRISMDLHDLSKRAKDYGSAAVLLSLLLCGGIWLAALWQRLMG
jgi:diacylglycerol kinase (ATP)